MSRPARTSAPPGVLAALKDHGCTSADVETGLDLVESAESAAGGQQAEYAGQYAATEAAQTAVADLEALYVHHRTLARPAHARGSEGYRGLAPAAVTDGLARVKAARTAMDTQSRETGEAQQATAAQDAAAVRLRAHAGEMARVATLAIQGRTQLRESLGLREHGA